MSKLFFEVPTQVKFPDDNGESRGGIAYKSMIICGCCGAVIPLALFKEEEVEELGWQDISLAITE